jgi:hypothetical protein
MIVVVVYGIKYHAIPQCDGGSPGSQVMNVHVVQETEAKAGGKLNMLL